MTHYLILQTSLEWVTVEQESDRGLKKVTRCKIEIKRVWYQYSDPLLRLGTTNIDREDLKHMVSFDMASNVRDTVPIQN